MMTGKEQINHTGGSQQCIAKQNIRFGGNMPVLDKNISPWSAKT
ncbi:MAG TPA: hypothetical protein VHB48_13070 [Chitinophagaceae bacterium]|nr:hypothetical protein [Chitinophagaceae bacterium]